MSQSAVVIILVPMLTGLFDRDRSTVGHLFMRNYLPLVWFYPLHCLLVLWLKLQIMILANFIIQLIMDRMSARPHVHRFVPIQYHVFCRLNGS